VGTALIGRHGVTLDEPSRGPAAMAGAATTAYPWRHRDLRV